MKSIVLSGLVAICLVVSQAFAQEGRTFSEDGVHLRYAGWHVVPKDDNALEQLIALEPDDVEASRVYRRCHLERARLPPNPGMTQAILNQRILTDGRRRYETSPAYASIGTIERVSAAEVDGIAVLDVIIAGRMPSWMHDRVFALVRADSSGDYYRFSCVAVAQPTSAQVSEMQTLLASLRFGSVPQ